MPHKSWRCWPKKTYRWFIVAGIILCCWASGWAAENGGKKRPSAKAKASSAKKVAPAKQSKVASAVVCAENLLQKKLLQPYDESLEVLWSNFTQNTLPMLMAYRTDIGQTVRTLAYTLGRISTLERQKDNHFVAERIDELFQILAKYFLSGKKEAFFSLLEDKNIFTVSNPLIAQPHIILQFLRLAIWANPTAANQQLRLDFKKAAFHFLESFKGKASLLDNETRVLISRVISEILPAQSVNLLSEQAIMLAIFREWFKDLKDRPDTQRTVATHFSRIASSILGGDAPFIVQLAFPLMTAKIKQGEIPADSFFSWIVKDYHEMMQDIEDPTQRARTTDYLVLLIRDSISRHNIHDGDLLKVLAREPWAYRVWGDETFLVDLLPFFVGEDKLAPSLQEAIGNMAQGARWRRSYQEKDLLERIMPFAKALAVIDAVYAKDQPRKSGKLPAEYFPAMRLLAEFLGGQLQKMRRALNSADPLTEEEKTRINALFEILAFLAPSVGAQDHPTLAIYYDLLKQWTQGPNLHLAPALMKVYYGIYPLLKTNPDFIQQRFFTKIIAFASQLPLRDIPGQAPQLTSIATMGEWAAIRSLAATTYLALYPGEQFNEEFKDLYSALTGQDFWPLKTDEQRIEGIRNFLAESRWCSLAIANDDQEHALYESFELAYGAALDLYPPFLQHQEAFHQQVLHALHDYTLVFHVLPPSSHRLFLIFPPSNFLWPHVARLIQDPGSLRHWQNYWLGRYGQAEALAQQGEFTVAQAAELDVLAQTIYQAYERLAPEDFARELGATLNFIHHEILPWYNFNAQNSWLHLLEILHTHLTQGQGSDAFIAQIQQHLKNYAGAEDLSLYHLSPGQIKADRLLVLELIFRAQLTNPVPAAENLGSIFARQLGLRDTDYHEYFLTMSNHLIARSLQELENTLSKDPRQVAPVRLLGILHNIYPHSYIDPQMPTSAQLHHWAYRLIFERVRPGSTQLTSKGPEDDVHFSLPENFSRQELRTIFDTYEYWQLDRMLNFPPARR